MNDENIKIITKTQKITAASIFGAISWASAIIAAYIPRLPGWGFALFDPVSIIWIIAFLIFGLSVGIMSTLLGTLGLMYFDPTGIGPFMKLIATLPMIIVPWLITRTKKNSGRTDLDYLLQIRVYTIAMIIALIIRLLLMIPLNLIIVPLFFSNIWTPTLIIEYTTILNSVQWIGDAWLSYIIVVESDLKANFKYW